MVIDKKNLSCFVLMPFSPEFTFVYEFGIKPALSDVLGDGVVAKFTRADETLAGNRNKIDEIKRSIEVHDVVIVDITGNNPNVLWELGYAQAKARHIIPLSQQPGQLPFNIRGLDVIPYENSVEGMNRLKALFATKLKGLAQEVMEYRSSLLFDAEVTSIVDSIQNGLSTISSSSILRNLARNELLRLSQRLSGLKRGVFDLRNEKPNSEIIQYFCDYISQLSGAESSFDTVSNIDFWQEITEACTNWDYLLANARAVAQGAMIRRVLIVDLARYPQGIESPNVAPIVQHLSREAHHSNGGMRMKVLAADGQTISVFKNFGILTKGVEQLLFVPSYTDDRRMKETDFWYSDKSRLGLPDIVRNQYEIERYRIQFESAWQHADDVQPTQALRGLASKAPSENS